MKLQHAMAPTAQEAEPRKKLRAVVFGGGIGMFPPLFQRLNEEFEIIATLSTKESRWLGAWYKLVSVRWPRHSWYRKWRYHMEKTAHAFSVQTREATQLLAPLRGQYDVILFFGAMFAPGTVIDKPIFLFTDSCRWLSSRNLYDSISHFANATHEAEWLALEGALYRKAMRVFTGSDFVRNALIERYDVAPDRVVRSGFGAGLAFGAPYTKQFDGRTILYIGKGDFEKKGGTLLMSAFEQVREVLPKAELHIVGQDRLPQVAGVISHGFVRDRNKLVELMRSAHVLALPSLVDRFGIALVEAMASSTPCVASDYGALPEIVGDAGIIAPCNDVDALATALIRILQDVDYARQLGERGRERYEETFNWDSVWKVIEREIRTALH